MNKVTKGFLDGGEINTVFYDPDVIAIDRMVDALTKAGTYIRTVEPSP